ncbi:chorismate mutase [Candidatus Gottesmanbacteria bacterium]|nr:chorismate mutase [Candidatus Gottesmanbacteria bacterium]
MRLNLLRQKIDREDQKILHILKNRMDLAMEIGMLKNKLNLPVENIDREKEVINKLKKRAKKMGLRSRFITHLFGTILKESKRIQS